MWVLACVRWCKACNTALTKPTKLGAITSTMAIYHDVVLMLIY